MPRVNTLQIERDRRRIAQQLRDQADRAAILISRSHSFFTCEEELHDLAKLISEARDIIGEYDNDYPRTPWEV